MAMETSQIAPQKDFVTRRPVLFALAVLGVYLFSQVLAGALSYTASSEIDQVVIVGVINGIGVLVCLALLYRLGWLKAAGVTLVGSWQVWLLTVLLIGYDLYFFHKALFDSAAIQVPPVGFSLLVALRHFLDGGLLQEFVFRGLLLYAFVRLWGDTRLGLLKSVLLSALFFSLAHLLNLLTGRHYSLVLMLMLDTLISGVVYAALVLYGRSLWPVVALHASINATVNLRAWTIPGFEETMQMWWAVLAFQILPLLLGAILLYLTPTRPVVPEAP